MARDKVIVYNGSDGFCRVVIPSEQCVLSDEDIIAKDISASEYSLVDNSSLPSKYWRNAWKYNHSSKAVEVDMASAKTLCQQELEAKFISIAKENADIQTIADMKGESASLKSNPAVPYSSITAATTVSDLDALL
tara:strand:+ start:21545 stop:21949 length:405 start_codon:yes stop_codon:yes gene_type:complete